MTNPQRCFGEGRPAWAGSALLPAQHLGSPAQPLSPQALPKTDSRAGHRGDQ